MKDSSPDAGLRLDKWLWAARFFKTRQLAVEAINGGKIQLNSQRAKPGKVVRTGARIRIHKGSLEWNILVKVVPKQRRPASEAILFYEEDHSSVQKRDEIIRQERLLRASTPHIGPGKPSKRDRRMIHRFTGKGD
ncbi:MAG: RNA-binding S4 domain-containing protein [Gammaproteobacteria bacterium]|nr:RNA-binding S4 domain-containing protein [Gammaproteobacteria bacterium]